jgi:hypothetical protein
VTEPEGSAELPVSKPEGSADLPVSKPEGSVELRVSEPEGSGSAGLPLRVSTLELFFDLGQHSTVGA